MRRLPILLALSYPLLAHLAVARGSEPLAIAGVAVLILGVTFPGLARGRVLAWLGVLAAGIALAALARRGAAWLPLYAPPILINAAMAWVFARTLVSGRVPLIEVLVRALHGSEEALDARIPPYARRLTLAWAVLLGALAAVNLLLALCATPRGILTWLGITPPIAVPEETWSLFANLLNYLILAGFFLVEYAFRRRIFPDQPYDGLGDFTRRLAAVGPRVFGLPRRRP